MANEYKAGNSYLVKPWNYSEISKMTVLEVTQTAYNIKWESGRNYWFLKKDFENDYKLIEDLGNLELKAISQCLNSDQNDERSVATSSQSENRTPTP